MQPQGLARSKPDSANRYIIRSQEIAMTSGLASLVVALAMSPTLVSFAGFPKVTTVEPDRGKVEDIISAKGQNLDKSSVGEVYLTDGTHDLKCRSRTKPRPRSRSRYRRT